MCGSSVFIHTFALSCGRSWGGWVGHWDVATSATLTSRGRDYATEHVHAPLTTTAIYHHQKVNSDTIIASVCLENLSSEHKCVRYCSSWTLSICMFRIAMICNVDWESSAVSRSIPLVLCLQGHNNGCKGKGTVDDIIDLHPPLQYTISWYCYVNCACAHSVCI